MLRKVPQRGSRVVRKEVDMQLEQVRNRGKTHQALSELGGNCPCTPLDQFRWMHGTGKENIRVVSSMVLARAIGPKHQAVVGLGREQ